MNRTFTVHKYFDVETKEYKEFLLQPFNLNDLPEYFSNLRLNDLYIQIQGYDEFPVFELKPYTVCVNNKNYTLPHPETLYDFIEDMNRVGIKLFFNLDYFGYEKLLNYVPKDEYENTIKALVDVIGKSEDEYL